MRQQILEDTKRTDDGTIDTSEDERQRNQRHYNHHVERHHGWEELDLCHPTKPVMQRPREVEEQQGYQYKEHCCKDCPDFT